MKLKNRAAIITGGGRGIGKAIAVAFAREGAAVFLVSRTESELEVTKKELEQYGVKVITRVADVANEGEVARVVQTAEEQLGKIDILVNAAGIHGPIGKLEELDADEWIKTFFVNMFGTMLMCRQVLSLMKKHGSGRIINFTGGGEGPFPRFTAYAASKGAVVRFTESLADEIKADGVFVNAIAPGPVNTEMIRSILEAGPEKIEKKWYEEFMKRREGGGISPEKAAELCVFLASDESAGLTGKVLSAVHDNWKEFPKYKKEIMESDVYTYRRIKPADRGMRWN